MVAVTAPAVDGRASEAIIELVANSLQVPKRSVRIKSGHRARTKILGIAVESGQGAQLSDLNDRIKALMADFGAP